MGFLSKINKKLGFSKGTKKRLRDLKRREALGFRPSYVENPMGRILKPRGLLGPTLNRSALQRKIAEMGAIRKKSPNMPITFDNPSFRMIGTPQPIPERMPQKRGGFGFGLGEAIRRLNQQQGMMPQPIPRAEIDISALEPLPIGEMPMTQDLPEVAPVGMMPQERMGGMQDMEPRMMMQEGEDVSLERELFSLQAQLKNLEEQLRLDRSYNDDQAVIDTSAKMASIQKRIQEIMNGMPQLAGGGDFPDLTGDGKVTQADILKGRGVQLKAEGGEMMMEETEMMAPSGDEIEASLMEVQDIQPEMQQLDQFVQMVIEMIQAGASEAEVIESLRQAGLDDDDIAAVFQAVMETMQGSMEQGGIDAELAQLS